MGSRMKNFNVMRVTGKFGFFGNCFMKTQYIGGNCLEKGGGLDSLKIQGEGRLGIKEGGVFEGGLIPQCPLWLIVYNNKMIAELIGA